MNRVEAEQCLPKLPPLRLKRLWQLLRRTDDEVLSPGESLWVWLAGLLHVSSPLEQDEIDAVLDYCREGIIKFGDKLEDCLQQSDDDEVEVAIVAILDRQFVAFSGVEKTLNLSTGALADHVTEVPLEVLSYNMAVLHATARKTLSAIRRKIAAAKAARQQAIQEQANG